MCLVVYVSPYCYLSQTIFTLHSVFLPRISNSSSRLSVFKSCHKKLSYIDMRYLTKPHSCLVSLLLLNLLPIASLIMTLMTSILFLSISFDLLGYHCLRLLTLPPLLPEMPLLPTSPLRNPPSRPSVLMVQLLSSMLSTNLPLLLR